MGDVLVAEGLCRGFGEGEARVEAVRSADLRVDPAELVVVLGPIRRRQVDAAEPLRRLDQPDEGRVTVAGRDVGALHGAERDLFLRQTVGWVFQAAGLLPLLSAEEKRRAGAPADRSRRGPGPGGARRALAPSASPSGPRTAATSSRAASSTGSPWPGR